MLRAEPEILRLLGEDAESLSGLLERRAEEAVLQFPVRGSEFSDLTIETLAVFLLAAVEGAADECPTLTTALPLLVENGPLDGQSQDGPEWEAMNLLLGAWVAMPDESAASQRLRIAARYGLPEGVAPALEILEGDEPTPGQRPEAILMIARFGGPEHVSLLEALLSDASEVKTRTSGRQVRFQSRLQDVALLALLHLTGQDPGQYGFDRLENNSFYIYSAGSAGFEDEESRTEALRKWETWRAVNRGGRVPPFDAIEGVGV
jgi:hypothetical protein